MLRLIIFVNSYLLFYLFITQKQDFWRDGAEDVTAIDEDSRAELSARFSKGNVKVRWFKGDMEIFHGEKYNFLMGGWYTF